MVAAGFSLRRHRLESLCHLLIETWYQKIRQRRAGMKEVAVRKFHRLLGMIVVWFLAVQALTGLGLAALGLALGDAPSRLGDILGAVHFGWSPPGGVYRIILGLATLAQGISGIIIFSLIRARSRKI